MKSGNTRRQRSFSVEGQKITIVSRMITRQANFCGWKVTINGADYRTFGLVTREEAEDSSYVKWVKENVPC